MIALLGAESTGKTTLAVELGARAARTQGARVAVVPRVPARVLRPRTAARRADEQAGIAAEQTRRIAAAAHAHDIVVADTTALMIAVYSEHVFGDRSLYAVRAGRRSAHAA